MAENQEVKGNDAAEKESAAESEKSLEELLKEFPEDTGPEPAQQKQVSPDVEERLARIEAVEARKELDKAITQTVDVLLDEEGYEKTPKRLARGFLHALAEENPSFQSAFANRQKNPSAWKKASQWAAKEFRKEYQPTGDSVSADLKAARASARGQSEQPERPKGPSPEEIRNMNPTDFRKYKESLGRS